MNVKLQKLKRWKLRKITLWIAGFFVLFSLIGFFVAPPVAKSILLKKLSGTLHRDITIESFRINPYTFSITVKGFTMKEKQSRETFISFDELYVNMEVMSLLKKALIIKEIRLIKPYIKVVRKEDESYNFSDIMKGTAKEADEKGKSTPAIFSINNISILNGSIDFHDMVKGVQHTVRDMRIAIPFISNYPTYANIFVKPEFSATINGDYYSLVGQVKPFAKPLETFIDVDIKDLDIPQYLTYIPVRFNFTVPSAKMDLKLRITYFSGDDTKTSLNVAGNISLREFILNNLARKQVISIKTLDVGISALEPFDKVVKLSQVTIQSPDFSITRGRDGSLNILGLIPDASRSPKDEIKATKKKEEQTVEKKVSFSVEKCTVADGKITFKDLMPAEPVDMSIQKMNLNIEKISSEKDSKANIDLSFMVGKRGTVSLGGAIGLTPLSGDLNVDVKFIPIAPFQNYFNDKVKIVITEGTISTKGNISVKLDKSGNPGAHFKGNLLISHLSSIDQETGNDFLKWKAFSLGSIDAGYNPTAVNIKDISLSDFYSRIIIYEDRTTNLQKVFGSKTPMEAEKDKEDKQKEEDKKEEKQKEQEITQIDTKPSTSTTPEVMIDNITLQGGAIDFTDFHVKPAFSAKLTELGGRVSRFILGKNHDSEVEVRGKINQFIPLNISGKINTAKDNLLIDLTGVVSNFEMNEMTPYSGKYIGYAIEKGKLSLGLKYSILKRKLDSQNIIFLDQFTLGDKVESPDAIKAPIKLAIALLKDRSGQIKLDIPVSGSIDDPQFRIGPIIWKIIVNLITKAATAPFALIGALFGGGGEELSYIEFDEGSSIVTDTAMKKIEAITKALHDRPALTLDIEGHISPERDREGLKKYILERKVKVQKMNEMVKRREKVASVDEVKIEPEEYEKYLTMAYKAEKFAKPRNVIGLTKKLPVSEMEKLMITNIKITDDDLRQLALRRANEVKNAILKTGMVEPERIFVIEPKSLPPGRKENVKDSRVDFKLR